MAVLAAEVRVIAARQAVASQEHHPVRAAERGGQEHHIGASHSGSS